MNLETIFTVKNEHLDLLNERTAVDFFQKLLWAEARRLGPGTCKVSVPSEIHVPDGGIDATVNTSLPVTQSDIIASGKNGYQIKSGTNFEPWQDGDIRAELFRKDPPSRENLRESIRICLDADGTYILVCTGIDCLVADRQQRALNHIKEYLEQCGYPNPKFDVWSQDTLCGFLKIFPSLALQVNGRGGVVFQTHNSWSRDANMRVPFFPGQSQNELIKNIQNELRRNDDTVHVRVWGEPGIGKTKLVLEATSTKDLYPLVIYCSAFQFRDSVLMNELLRDDNQFSVILVIDECDPDSRSYIWDKLRYRGPRIKLITIYNDYEERARGITYHVTPPLDNEQISSIIQGHNIPKDQADRWAELCSGSPRVAHVIGWNLVNNPEDLLNPSTVDIWERYIAAGEARNSERTEQRHLVL